VDPCRRCTCVNGSAGSLRLSKGGEGSALASWWAAAGVEVSPVFFQVTWKLWMYLASKAASQ